MRSSTLHSKSRLPRLALLLACTALGALWLGATFTLHTNAELRFYKAAIERKRLWAQRLDAHFPAKTVVVGGSSCSFSIDGERMEREHGMPTLNCGLHMGFGVPFLTRLALDSCRAGDTLVLAFEPGLFTRPLGDLTLAIQESYALGEPGLLTNLMLDHKPREPLREWLTLRPGGTHLCAMAGKALMRMPMYRYSIEEVHPSGWQTTPVRMVVQGPPGHGSHLSADGRAYLIRVREECRRRNLRVVYSMPWCFTPASALASHRRDVASYLRQVAEIVPVLKDESLGCQSDASFFADTVWHLIEPAAALRTDGLAEQLRASRLWKAEELDTLAQH